MRQGRLNTILITIDKKVSATFKRANKIIRQKIRKKMQINVENLAKVASFFTPISHTPGRLRVRVNPKIKELSSNVNLGSIDETIAKIDGIKNVKLNKIIGSVTIEYDHAVFPKNLWDDLLGGRNLEALSNKINAAKEAYLAK